MRKRSSWIVLLILFSTCVFAAYKLEYQDARCYPDGSIQINVINRLDPIQISEISLLKGEAKVPGDWYINNLITKDIQRYEEAEFRSDDNEFGMGHYTLTFTYPTIGDSIKTFDVYLECPKFVFACSPIEVDIIDCYIDEGNFFMRVYAKGLNQGTVLDLRDDFVYFIKLHDMTYPEYTLPHDLKVESYLGTKYDFTFSTDSPSIDMIRIRTSGCDMGDYPNSTDTERKCRVIESDDTCEDFSGDYLKDQCYIREAILQNDSDLCTNVIDSGRQGMCYMNVAVENSDIEVCNNFEETSSYYTICMENFGVELDDSMDNISIEFDNTTLVNETVIKDIVEDVVETKEDLLAKGEEVAERLTEEIVEFIEDPNEPKPSISLQKFTTAPYVFIYAGIIVIVAGLLIFLILAKRRTIEPKTMQTYEAAPSRIDQKVTDAITINNFTVIHGNKNILNNVGFTVNRGELVCLLGPSGTGKSTIIESLLGRKRPTSGSVQIFNTDISAKDVYSNVGFVPQHPELYMNQTVEQNMTSSATKWGVNDSDNQIEKNISLVGLTNRKEIHANKLSGGQLKLLSLAMELIREPELLVLDEPTTGLDPNTRESIITILSRIVSSQKTVFFTSHHMDDAEQCDNIIILAQGQVIQQGTPSKLKKSLPGMGKIVNIELDNVTDELMMNIEKLEGVEKVISEGRTLKIISRQPNAVKLGQQISDIGGTVNKTEITNASMTEVFIFYTGVRE